MKYTDYSHPSVEDHFRLNGIYKDKWYSLPERTQIYRDFLDTYRLKLTRGDLDQLNDKIRKELESNFTSDPVDERTKMRMQCLINGILKEWKKPFIGLRCENIDNLDLIVSYSREPTGFDNTYRRDFLFRYTHDMDILRKQGYKDRILYQKVFNTNRQVNFKLFMESRK